MTKLHPVPGDEADWRGDSYGGIYHVGDDEAPQSLNVGSTFNIISIVFTNRYVMNPSKMA